MSMAFWWEVKIEEAKVMRWSAKLSPRWQAKRRSNSHSQPPKAPHQSAIITGEGLSRKHNASEIQPKREEKRLFVRDLGFMYMTSISTYTKKKRSSTSTPLEGSVLPLSSIMISASLICFFARISLLLCEKKPSLLQNQNRSLDYKLFCVCIFVNARKNKKFRNRVQAAGKWRRELEEILKDRSENFVVDVCRRKTECYSQLLKEAAVTCQNDHLKERKISENRKK